MWYAAVLLEMAGKVVIGGEVGRRTGVNCSSVCVSVWMARGRVVDRSERGWVGGGAGGLQRPWSFCLTEGQGNGMMMGRNGGY